MTFTFMTFKTKLNIKKKKKKNFYFGWKSCWLIAALPAGEWLFRIILDARNRKSSNNGLIKDEPETAIHIYCSILTLSLQMPKRCFITTKSLHGTTLTNVLSNIKGTAKISLIALYHFC